MERRMLTPRPHWQSRVEALGFHFHTAGEVPYWDESVCYRLSMREVEVLEQAADHLQALYIEATEYAFSHDLSERLRIPRTLFEYARRSWEQEEPSLYGRFDLRFDGCEPPKLIEYNADTPTALAEAAIVQWFWLQEVFPGADQFNSMHEKLLSAFAYLRDSAPLAGAPLHFACLDESPEDLYTVTYLRDVATQAGFSTRHLYVHDIGYDPQRRAFVDLEEQAIATLFKLYPWEWLATDDFGPLIAETPLRWLEPAWKALWSNKAMLALLWELFEGDPHLLAASDTAREFPGGTVRKPVFSREGANIEICAPGLQLATPGTYGAEGHIWQQYCPLPQFAGYSPLFGVWVVGGEAAGLGIRESNGPVTDNQSRFVPHYIGE
jgi:glutathionylspermidine synthase